MNRKGNRLAVAMLALAFAAGAFFLFYDLGSPEIQDWDEARHGMNAYEMVQGGDWAAHTYDGALDYYNLKPPISVWLSAIGMKAFGFNAFGMRFFSPLFVLLTVALLAFVSWRLYGGEAAGICALVFFGLRQIYLSHYGRTADPDAPYVFFAALSFAAMLLPGEKKRFAALGGLGFSLAFLTKSWHALAILGVWGAWLLLSGAWLRLGWKGWLGVAASILVPIGAWVLLRRSRDGWTFFEAMIRYDLLDRTANVLERHSGPIWYYLPVFLSFSFQWIFVIGLALLLRFARAAGSIVESPVEPQGKQNFNWRPSEDALALMLWMIIPFALFSVARTKLGWYIYICFPPFAVIAGKTVSRAIAELWGAPWRKRLLLFAVFGSFALTLAYVGLQIIPAKPDPAQAALADLGRSPETRGFSIYLEYDDGSWSPGRRLAARLYADLSPADGGLTGFARADDRSSLLIVDRDSLVRASLPFSYSILSESATVVLIQRKD